MDYSAEAFGWSPEEVTSDQPETKWKIGNQTVQQGDCLKLLQALPNETIDIVVTSPPYNIGLAYHTYSDNMPRQEYLDWLTEVGKQIFRVMTDNGSFFLNVGGTNTDPWIVMDVANAFRKVFALQNHITWVKSVSIGDDTVGHFKPINSRRFLNNNHEAIFHFTKHGAVPLDRLAVGVPYKDKSNISRWDHAKTDRRCAGNTWFIPYETVQSKTQKFDHPAGFPVGLPDRCIRLHGNTDSVVLDPFLGAGTTLFAAESLGITGIGFELDTRYALAAVDRLKTLCKRNA